MDFKEDLLQMVWKYQYFEKRQLTTTDGLSLEVKKIGYHNFYEGPDFLEALIKIGIMDHFGHVEVHRKSSDWKNHSHDSDQRYDAVILHVVWEDDKPILRKDGSHIPTLELKGKIWLDVLRNYERLVSSKDEILCGSELKDFLPIIKFSMLEKALVERLEKKSEQLIRILEKIKNDWEEGTYRWLFQCFGFKTNSAVMLRLAESIPYRTLQKHGKQPLIIEAILLGQADLIPENTEDEYGKHLKKEYDFYQTKYSLKKTIHHQEWKMMGVRPHNFPAVRIAQLAQILSNNPNLFSSVINASDESAGFKKAFEIQVPNYWQQHFKIGGVSQKKLSKKLSNNTLALLTINFTVPLWYAYGQYLQDSEWKEKCFDVLQDLAAEDNFIIRKFSFHSWKAQNAFDSQGMLGLYHDYCKPKKCLECKIGQNLLKPGKN